MLISAYFGIYIPNCPIFLAIGSIRWYNENSVANIEVLILKIGIVLEGGGVRGIYTAGVLDVFMDEGLSFDGLVGVSAGAAHGCSYLSDQKGRSIRYYKKYCNDHRFMSMRNWIREGNVVGVQFSYHDLPEKLDLYDYDAFNRCGVPFYAVCSNVETGLAEYIRIEDMADDIDYLRASASLPYFSRIVEINGKKYLDGGCCDAIPVEAFRKMGFEKNVVVLTRPVDYIKKPEPVAMAKLVYRKYPKFVEAMKRRHEMYNQTVEHIKTLEKNGDIFVIRPETDLPASRLEHDPAKVQATYDIGASDAKKAMKELKIWMEDNR